MIAAWVTWVYTWITEVESGATQRDKTWCTRITLIGRVTSTRIAVIIVWGEIT